MSKLKISIVTPSYNQAGFLDAAIRSVVAQDYENLEYIVIDGGSTDGSQDVIKSYSEKIAFYISEPDRGHWDALQKGFSVSTGEIMGWINSDDMLTPWSLSCISQIFEQFPHVKWIQGANSFWNLHGHNTGSTPNPKNIYDFLIGDFQWIQQESVFWRRSLWNEAGSHVSSRYRFMVDGELWSRFFLHAELYSVGCILSGYRMHGLNRASLNLDSCNAEMREITATLRSKVPKNVAQCSRYLNIGRWVSKSFLFDWFRLSYYAWLLFAKVFFRHSSRMASYRAINWNYSSSSWEEITLPFRP